MRLSTEKILAEVEGGIGWLTFNHPERRNAMSLEMWQGVADALESFQHDPDVRVVVMKGAGGQAFVSGADISEFDRHRASAEQQKEYSAIAGRGNRWLRKLDKPLIAMIQGYCIGGGLNLAICCDLRFCSEGSRFGLPAAKLGLGYGYAGLKRYIDTVGPAHTRD